MGTTESPTFYSDPQIRHLTQVLEDIHRGVLLFPRFQRPLVWSKEMRLALLDSVLQGVPIQTIIIWRTDINDVSCQERLGPFQMPRPTQGEHQYVLDGEQRLSTLYFALFPTSAEPETDGEHPDDFIYFYDLRSKEDESLPQFCAKSDVDTILPYYLPLTDLLDGKKLTRFQRKLSAFVSEEDKLDSLIELSDHVADSFRQYKLPIVTIKANDINVVTRTFQRVNGKHATMSEVHMVNALSYSSKFDLLERLSAMRQEPLASVGWGDLDEQVILRVCKVLLDRPVYEENADDMAHELAAKPDILDAVAQHLMATAQFLKEECGIGVPDLVPYTAQIILVAAAFMTTPVATKEQRSALADWIWLTTYTEVFQRQMSESRFGQLREDVRRLAQGKLLWMPDRPPIRERITRFDFRHARSRALALLLAEQNPVNASGVQIEDCYNVLAQHRVQAMPQLVTATMVKNERWSRSPGARVLLLPGQIGDFRRILQHGRQRLPANLLRSHLISDEAHSAFFKGDYGLFVELREEEMNRMEDEWFQNMLERLYQRVQGRGRNHPRSRLGRGPNTR